MTVYAVSLVSGLVLTLGSPAGISVSPDDRDPRIVIEGERVTPPGERGGPRDPGVGWPGSPRPETDEERIRREIGNICQIRVVAPVPGFPCLLIPPGSPEPGGDGGPGPGGREITPEEVEQVIREIDLPSYDVRVEPTANTLVNLPTNFYAAVEDTERSLDLLGHTVRLRASPERFTWHHGDGSSQTSDSPGAPYPDLAVTHRYREPSQELQVRLEVGYRVEYTIDDGEWRQLDDLITASGPPTSLAVHEASPILVEP